MLPVRNGYFLLFNNVNISDFLMPILPLVYAPHPIFKQTAQAVEKIDDTVLTFLDNLSQTLYVEKAVGMAAPMVGVLQRIVVVDTQDTPEKKLYEMINPTIIGASAETQTFEEASLCFPYIAADITRPHSITVTYLDRNGHEQKLEAAGFLSSVIQHELDYLDGRVFLDYLSPLKRSMLLKKMQKQMKMAPMHVHGEHCNH